MAVASANARRIFGTAYEDTQTLFRSEDTREFLTLSIRDIYEECLRIDDKLALNKRIRNMRRVRPFLEGIERYSKVIEPLCNGTPFLPWIWAPTKLILQISAEHESAVEKIVSAYGRIGDVLPRLNRLSSTLVDEVDFQQILAFVFADILEFHREAYKFLHRPGWKLLFDALVTGFNRRLDHILSSLAHHSDMIDREANAINICRAEEWRRKAIEDATRQEELLASTQLKNVLAWLNTRDAEQENELNRHLEQIHANSCLWIRQHPLVKPWLSSSSQSCVLWVHGAPGAGQSQHAGSWGSLRCDYAKSSQARVCSPPP